MTKKYRLMIITITALLVLSLVVSTSYGLYRLTNKEKTYVDFNDDCLEIVADDYNIDKDLAVLNETNGKTSIPYSMAFTNICSEDKEWELRLNVLENSNINRNEMMVYVNGDLKVEPVVYSSFINSASNKKDNNLYSKILGSITIPAGSTKRINIRMWVDDTRVTMDEQNVIAKVEVSNTKTIIKPIFKQTILNNNVIYNGVDPIDFSKIENTNPIFASTVDESGISYYFRGPVTNNYVSFAGMLWQIIRINGDGSVRLIYAGDEELLTQFNEKYNDSKYLGLKYIEDGGNLDSTVNNYLNNWYQEHLINYDNYITESTFCNDTSNVSTYGPNYYGAYNRLNDGKPSLVCPKEQENYGGVYNAKIGLISADEVAFAGGVRGQGNSGYYLHTGYSFYTLSPSRYANNVAYMSIVNLYGTINDIAVNTSVRVRPVISLESIVSVTGRGTIDNPYIVDPLED